ncbi:MAG: hypothetical protein H7233_04675 [Pseudorhodobacter sp.]|nr:hypothetical protein [Frankiaceae bacterium]
MSQWGNDECEPCAARNRQELRATIRHRLDHEEPVVAARPLTQEELDAQLATPTREDA